MSFFGFSLVRNSAVADRTDRGLSVEDGRYHRLLIENVYNVESAIVSVSELQTNIYLLSSKLKQKIK